MLDYHFTIYATYPILLVPVVQKVDSTIHWIAQLVSLTLIHWIVIYPVELALSSFWTTGGCIITPDLRSDTSLMELRRLSWHLCNWPWIPVFKRQTSAGPGRSNAGYRCPMDKSLSSGFFSLPSRRDCCAQGYLFGEARTAKPRGIFASPEGCSQSLRGSTA